MGTGSEPSLGEKLKVAIVASMGTIIEAYDNFLTALVSTAIWPFVFFPKFNPLVGVLAGVTTFAIGLASRPVGALIFGHFSDRVGRKFSLIWTLIAMGGGTLAIALTPPYQSIGILGGILVIIFRFIQGMGFGGEWGGATSILSEYTLRSRWRAVWVSWVPNGVSFGLFFAALAYVILTLLFPRQEIINFAWRLPFIAGTIVIIIGVLVRYTITESPVFSKLLERGDISRAPSIEVLRKYWKRILMLSAAWWYVIGDGFLVNTVAVGIMLSTKLTLLEAYTTVMGAAVAGGITAVLGAALADRIGRKKTLLISSGITMLISFPYLYLLTSGNLYLDFLAQSMWQGVLFIGQGVGAGALFAESFPTKYRASGVGLAFTFGAAIAGTLVPILSQTMIAISHGVSKAWPEIATLVLVVALISFTAGLFVRDTSKVDLER